MQGTPPPSAVQLDVQLLFQIIGELFVENYVRKREQLANGSEGIQAGPRRVREGEPTSTSDTEMLDGQLPPKVSRQDFKR